MKWTLICTSIAFFARCTAFKNLYPSPTSKVKHIVSGARAKLISFLEAFKFWIETPQGLALQFTTTILDTVKIRGTSSEIIV